MVNDLETARRLISDRLPREAAVHGWTRRALNEAAAAAEVDEAFLHALFPGGVLDALAELSSDADARARDVIEAADLSTMRVRERITFAVRTRIEQETDQEAVRRAAVRLAAPDAVGLGPKLLFATADALWLAVGDRSTDANYYSKRAILSGVYAATLAVWSRGDTEAAWEFLDRRITNVMSFEKAKAAIQKTGPGRAVEGVIGWLGARRYRS